MNNAIVFVKKWLETSTQKQKLTVALVVFSVLCTLGLMTMTGASGSTNDPLESTPFYFVGVFVKLIVVLLLIVASSVIFRRWLQPGLSGGKTQQVRLLETVRLSPKQALHLVSVGGKQLLVGATDQGISLITTCETQPAAPELTEVKASQSAVEFSSLLQTYFCSPDTSSNQA